MYSFSLILATYGRLEEIDYFLSSILNSNYNLNQVEIIIVDQNDKLVLDEVIKKYNPYLDIKHIKSKEKGLSRNRNIGIEISSGKYIAFPDDDCKYMEDTLSKVDKYFDINPDIYAVMGRIIDENENDCIRKWPRKDMYINTSNFYTKLSSITLFKRNNIKSYFDENLGVGTKFGSNEDADIIYRSLKEKRVFKYFNDIVLFHPKPPSSIEINKVYSYGMGFGRFCRKNIDVKILILYFKVLVYHMIKLTISILKFNKEEVKLRFCYLKSRVEGFLKK